MAIEPSPRLALAPAAVPAPVPPSAIARSVIPDIEPPLIVAVSATRLSILAVPSIYRSFHSFVTLPRSSVSSVSDIKDVLTATEARLLRAVFAPLLPVASKSAPLIDRLVFGLRNATVPALSSQNRIRSTPGSARDAPVPPSASAKSVIPVIEPPVIETLAESCVAIVPSPRLVLAPAAVPAPVPPSAMARSVIPVTDPPVIETLAESCVAIVPRPRFVLDVPALAMSDRLLVDSKSPPAAVPHVALPAASEVRTLSAPGVPLAICNAPLTVTVSVPASPRTALPPAVRFVTVAAAGVVPPMTLLSTVPPVTPSTLSASTLPLSATSYTALVMSPLPSIT